MSQQLRPAFDTHTHVFRNDLPMVAGRRYTPLYSASPAMLIDRLDRHQVSGAVLVQPSFLGTDNSYMLDALANAPGRLRGVAVLAAETSADDIHHIHAAGVRGHRFNLLGRDIETELGPEQRDAWAANIALFRDLDWHVELHDRAHRLAPLMSWLVDSAVRVVIDHFGLPDPDRGRDDPDWRTLIERACSDGADVSFKISAPYRLGGVDACILARALIETVGPERLLWGSDWPWTQHEDSVGYRDLVSQYDAWIGGASDVAAALDANARRLFDFSDAL
ncbi:MAG: amidohydrolase family protein [Pseudomonadota bacterium]